MATIYDLNNGYVVADGLQGSDVCDEAARVAIDAARDLKRTVVLEDDDGDWLIGPRGSTKRFTAALKRRYGFDSKSDEE